MTNIKTQVCFRFLNLDKFQAITLTREVSAATYKIEPEKERFIGSVYVNDSLDNLDDLTIFTVRQKIPLKDCDILIAVSSESGCKTFAVPINLFPKPFPNRRSIVSNRGLMAQLQASRCITIDYKQMTPRITIIMFTT